MSSFWFLRRRYLYGAFFLATFVITFLTLLAVTLSKKSEVTVPTIPSKDAGVDEKKRFGDYINKNGVSTNKVVVENCKLEPPIVRTFGESFQIYNSDESNRILVFQTHKITVFAKRTVSVPIPVGTYTVTCEGKQAGLIIHSVNKK